MLTYLVGGLLGLWSYDRLFHRARRMTRYYVTRERDGVLTVSHEPLFLYSQDRETFLNDREVAYAKIAAVLPRRIEVIKSESMWLDYAREGWTVTRDKNTRRHRLAAVYFYWMNVRNWAREPGVSWWAIGDATFQTATMTCEGFRQRFGQKGGE